MNRFIAILFLVTAITSNIYAQCDSCGGSCSGPVCVGKAEVVEVEKHCWEVECEQICVPAVRFPWEPGGKLNFGFLFGSKHGKHCHCDSASCDGGCAAAPSCGCAGAGCLTCCPPKCGFVVGVKRLKKKAYTDTACEYSMELQDRAVGCVGCADPGCAGCAAAPVIYETAPAQPTQIPHTTELPATSEPPVAPVPSLDASAKQGQGQSLRLRFVSLKSRLFDAAK